MMSESHAPRTFRQKLVWPGMLFIMVGTLIAVDATMVIVATSDPSFAVSEHYGEDGESWAERHARDQVGASLGWDCSTLVRSARSGGASFEVTLSDAESQPLDAAVIDVRAYHNARASEVVSFALQPDAARPGVYVVQAPLQREGEWTFLLTMTTQGSTWTHEVTHYFYPLSTTEGETS